MQAEIPRNTGILGVFSRFMMGLVQPMGKVYIAVPLHLSHLVRSAMHISLHDFLMTHLHYSFISVASVLLATAL